jgi:hypothetical protein
MLDAGCGIRGMPRASTLGNHRPPGIPFWEQQHTSRLQIVSDAYKVGVSCPLTLSECDRFLSISMTPDTTATMTIIDPSFDEEKMDTSMQKELPSAPRKLSRRGLLLVPQPTDDSFDPLNFSRLRKVIVLAVICIWAIIGPLNMIAIAPAFFPISKELNISLTTATYLVGAPLLSYGVASLIWVALGNRFGVRLVFVSTSLIAGLFCIWGAKANSAASLIAARTLTSIFSASPETLGPQVIADVFFLDDRAMCIGLFTLFQGSGFAMGSLIGGFITADLGWRWIQWIVAILSLSTSLLLFLFFPETQYTRESDNLHRRERKLVDELRFWAVSGGGKKKVDKYGWPSSNLKLS